MTESSKIRFLFICIACTVVAGAIILQMIRIPMLEGAATIMSDSEDYQGVYHLIYPDRGNIYDARGNLLAGNETAYEVGIDLRVYREPETIASVASSVLGLDYGNVLTIAQKSADDGPPFFIVLDNFVEKDKIDQLEVINEDYKARARRGDKTAPSLSGLVWTPHSHRSYPEGELGSNILGFYSYLDRTGGIGYFGVEESYDNRLSGTPKEVFYAFDPQRLSAVEEVPPGVSLVLTIDREIQSMTEQVLDEAIEWSGSEGGTIVIYNPEDGGIIAMATTPRLDPNKYWEYGDLFPNPMPYNSAISKTYEPGSVFKVLTMAAALDSGLVTPESTFNDTGAFSIGGATIYNWNRGGWGMVNMTECLQYSLNVCMAWLSTEMGSETFYSYVKAFGLDRKTNIDLGGESTWPIKLPGVNDWYEVDLATNSFGQGISLTPIQMVTAIGALANDGRMMAPHVVKSMIIDGQQYDVDPVVVGTPVKAETATTLTEMLKNSLENEASVALVEGYSVAGKTGTGEIAVQGGYSSSATNASFVGWGPVEDPKFLVYVWLEKPSISQWGSETAAPTFSKLVSKLVVLMDIPPDSVRLSGNMQATGE